MRGEIGEAIVSYGAYQRLFGARPEVIGTLLEFAGVRENDVFRVVGVMPEGLRSVASRMFGAPRLVEAPMPTSFRR